MDNKRVLSTVVVDLIRGKGGRRGGKGEGRGWRGI